MLRIRFIFSALLALLVAFNLTFVFAEGTPAGTVINNVANATFNRAGADEVKPSNPVETTVSSICNLSILPNGTVAAPAHDLTLESTGTLYLPYSLTNTGNDTLSFDVAAVLATESTLTPDGLSLILDENASGTFDAGEPNVSEISLAADETAALLLAVTVDIVERAGDLYVNVTGACTSDASISDTDNISHIAVPLFGFSQPTKTAQPEPGSVLFPGAAVTYTISFTAKSGLTNVVVTDTLSEYLAAPTAFTSGTIEDPETSLTAAVSARYDEPSRTLIWTLDSVPAGMTVTLVVDTTVREDLTDLPAETVVENTATVTSDSQTSTQTNTVPHDLRPIVIDLDKTASPSEISVGEVLRYTLRVTNPLNSVPLETLELSDVLPDVVRYKPDTTVVTFPDKTTQALEPTVDGQSLSWLFTEVALGDTFVVAFDVTILPSALYVDEIINSATALAQDAAGQAVADAAAAATTPVDLGVFEQRSVLLGTAFIDTDGNGLFDKDRDPPVEGLRLYLADGSSTVTDEFGRYTFQNLEASLTALRVDMTTAPSRAFLETPGQDKDGFWRVRLEPGIISRQDIPFAPPQVHLEVEQFLNVFMGPVALEKQVFVQGDALEVQLFIRSDEALKDVALIESLPEGASLLSPPSFADGASASATGLEFSLGDIPAGYEQTIRYTVSFEGEPEQLLTAPELRWDVR